MMLKILQLSNNRQVSYLEQGQGQPLFLIHGVGLQSLVWQPQIKFFSKNFKVIAIDLPGHGKSSKLIKNKPDLEDYVFWLIEVLNQFKNQLNFEKINLIGHSMGALISIGISINKPELIKKLIILNGVFKRTKEAKESVINRANLLKQRKKDIEGPLNRWFNHEDRTQTKIIEIIKNIKNYLEEVDLDAYIDIYSAFALGDDFYAKNLNEIKCQSLFITGDKDFNSTPEMSLKMSQLVKDSKFLILKNQGHIINLTASEIVNNNINSFLNN